MLPQTHSSYNGFFTIVFVVADTLLLLHGMIGAATRSRST